MKEHNISKVKTERHGLTRYIMSLAVSIACSTVVYAEQPKLLVGIVVDGLKQETLDMLAPHLDKDGLGRFVNEGVIFDNIDFGANLDATAASAVIMTGASPGVNGIGAEYIYEPDARRLVHVFSDDKSLGNFSDKGFSPKALRTTTISDEVRIAGAGVTYVYAIAPTVAQAMILGGHAGNNAIWFNDKNGKWSTTTYFSDMPVYPLNANRTNIIANKLDTLQWTPSATTAKAVNLPNHLTRYPFRYTFAGKSNDKYLHFAASPFINQEISSLARDYIKGLELGRHDGTDVLNLSFELQPYEFSSTPENRFELYDSYLKLDKALADLIRVIDKNVGRQNVVIYLAGTPSQTVRRKDESKWKIPGGEFSSRKAASLLNMYLIALHGNGDWIKAFYNGHFYLNEDLVKKQNKDIELLRRQSAECLRKMAGVANAFTIENLLNASPGILNAKGRAQSTVIDQAGDVIVDLIPGWTLKDDFNNPSSLSHTVTTNAPTTGTFMLLAPNMSSQRIQTVVDARAIAPTIAGLLHIRSPNGASEPPIMLK